LFKVTEYGTEAAAATAVFITYLSEIISGPKVTVTVRVDQPFIYLLTDRKNNIFFGGIKKF
jgi:serine protease inhibitor